MDPGCGAVRTMTRARSRNRHCRLLLVLLAALPVLSCQSARLPPDRAIVLLISIDGWRHDYLDRFKPPTLGRLAAEGVRSDGLIPQFPSKTFPNHYTIVTGLRPANHGILSNNMTAPDIPGEFSMSNRDVVADPRWWKGEPIWNAAERQGRVAAAMFWPGSETVIGGRQATFWRAFDNALPHHQRVAQILEWLRLPEGKRPSFLTLYYSDVDNAGHRGGPDSDAVREAALRVDRSLGELVEGVREIGLADRVNYVLVSDHGMSALKREQVIVLDDYIDLDSADIIDWSPVLGVSARDGDVERLYKALKDKHPSLTVYRNTELPMEYRSRRKSARAARGGHRRRRLAHCIARRSGSLGPGRTRSAGRHARLRPTDLDGDAGPVCGEWPQRTARPCVQALREHSCV